MAIEGRTAGRERILRTLTFWARPAFALRAVNRFQRIAGFDRAVALASSALTALIPLAVVSGAVLTRLGAKDVAERIIERYDLSGGGAEAVRDVFSPAGGTRTSVSITGTLLLMVAVLSFTRALQRVFEQTWELPPLSVRNTLNGLRWALVFCVYAVANGAIHAVLGQKGPDVLATAVSAPVSFAFLIWSGYWLSAKRISRRGLVPFAVIGAVALAIYALGAAIYVPRQFTSYADHYGVLGAVLAMISTLFCIMFVVVAAAALGREVHDELDGIRNGRRPPDDEVRQEWDNVMEEARAHWQTARSHLDRLRERH